MRCWPRWLACSKKEEAALSRGSCCIRSGPCRWQEHPRPDARSHRFECRRAVGRGGNREHRHRAPSDLAPSTDAEWAALRLKALALAEAAEAVAGARDASSLIRTRSSRIRQASGDLTPAQAQAAIEKDRPAFAAFSASLAKAPPTPSSPPSTSDLEAYSNAGGTLDEVCEALPYPLLVPERAQASGALISLPSSSR